MTWTEKEKFHVFAQMQNFKVKVKIHWISSRKAIQLTKTQKCFVKNNLFLRSAQLERNLLFNKIDCSWFGRLLGVSICVCQKQDKYARPVNYFRYVKRVPDPECWIVLNVDLRVQLFASLRD